MSSELKPPVLCKDCPIFESIGGQPSRMREEESIPPFPSKDGAPMEELDENGKIVGRISVLSLFNPASGIAGIINVPGKFLDNGTMLEIFKECEGPTPKYDGRLLRMMQTLKIKQTMACTAMKIIKELADQESEQPVRLRKGPRIVL